jgi:hypothetical protein
MHEPWLVHFFQRHKDDDPARLVPSIDFLDGLPDKIAAEIPAVLAAVAARRRHPSQAADWSRGPGCGIRESALLV